nr:tetratricopeptide repeat protein [uncultured Methanospirillum sp.]
MNRSDLFVFILVCILSISGVGRADQVQDLLAQGVAAYNSQDYSFALSCFEKVILLDPSLPYGWLWKGTVLQSLGRIGESDDAFRTGRCLLDPNQCAWDENIKTLPSPKSDKQGSNIRTEGPISINLVTNLGPTSNQSSSFKSQMFGSTESKDSVSEEKIDAGLHNQGKSSSDYRNDSNNYKNQGDLLLKSSPEQALDKYEKASEYGLDDPELYQRKGDVERQLGNDDNALESYKQGLENSPDNLDLPKKLGDVSQKKGLGNAAEQAYSKALNQAVTPADTAELLKGLINTNIKSGNYSAAKGLLDRLSSLPSGFGATPDVAELKADLNFKSGDFNEAEKNYEKIWNARPTDPQPGFCMAASQLNQGKIVEAKKTLEKISGIPLNTSQSDQFNRLRSRISYPSQSETTLFPALSSAGYLWLLLLLGVVGVVVLFKRKLL